MRTLGLRRLGLRRLDLARARVVQPLDDRARHRQRRARMKQGAQQCHGAQRLSSRQLTIDLLEIGRHVSGGKVLMMRAGTPPTSLLGGTSAVTTEPAATTLEAPMRTPGRMVARAPIQHPLPISIGSDPGIADSPAGRASAQSNPRSRRRAAS